MGTLPVDENRGRSATARLVAVRHGVVLLWGAILMVTPYERLAELPSDALTPVGIGRVLFAAPIGLRVISDSMSVWILRWSGVGLCSAWLVAGRRTSRIVLVALFADVAILDSLARAAGGFVNHAQIGPLLALAVVAFTAPDRRRGVAATDAGSQRPVRSDVRSERAAAATLRVLTLVIVLPYTYIGVNRCLMGGLSVFTGRAIRDYALYSSLMYSSYGFGLDRAWLSLPVVVHTLNVGFIVTTAFEVCTAAVYRSARFRLCWLLVMTGFHATVLLTMRILFWENILLAWLLIWFGLRHWPPSRTRCVQGQRDQSPPGSTDGCQQDAAMMPHRVGPAGPRVASGPRRPRSASESAVRHVLPRSQSIPSKCRSATAGSR